MIVTIEGAKCTQAQAQRLGGWVYVKGKEVPSYLKKAPYQLDVKIGKKIYRFGFDNLGGLYSAWWDFIVEKGKYPLADVNGVKLSVTEDVLTVTTLHPSGIGSVCIVREEDHAGGILRTPIASVRVRSHDEQCKALGIDP